MGLDVGVSSSAGIFSKYLVVYIEPDDFIVILNSDAQLWNPECQP